MLRKVGFDLAFKTKLGSNRKSLSEMNYLDSILYYLF